MSWRWQGAGLVLATALAAGVFAAAMPAADHELLASIYAEERISTTSNASVSAYFSELVRRAFGLIGGVFENLGWTIGTTSLILWLLVIAVSIVLLYLLLAFLAPRLGGTRSDDAVQTTALGEPPAEKDLRARFEAERARGNLRAALRTLWLIVTLELSAQKIGRFDTRLTNREFVRSVRREAPEFHHLAALERLARAIDWLFYGGDAVRKEDLPPLESLARKILS